MRPAGQGASCCPLAFGACSRGVGRLVRSTVESVRILFVSKPVAEPFHDGSACLVRDLATHLGHHVGSVMGIAGRPPWPPGPGRPEVLPVYRARGGFAPGMRDNARVVAHLLQERRADLWHFVFAPNRRSSRVVRGLRQLRRRPVVQTIASPPKSFDGVSELLFGDVVVAQSQWTAERVRASCPRLPVEVIPPALGEVATPTAAACDAVRRRLQIRADDVVVVYPGDLEFSRGAMRVAEMVEPLVRQFPRVVVVYACRRKTADAALVEAQLLSRLDSRHVRFAGELPSLLPLLQIASVVVFPVEDLWAKVDIPIAVLEAMALGTAVVVSSEGPLAELEAPLQVKPNDTYGWIEAILAALGEQVRPELIERQRDSIRRCFDASHVAARYEALYSALLGTA